MLWLHAFMKPETLSHSSSVLAVLDPWVSRLSTLTTAGSHSSVSYTLACCQAICKSLVWCFERFVFVLLTLSHVQSCFADMK